MIRKSKTFFLHCLAYVSAKRGKKRETELKTRRTRGRKREDQEKKGRLEGLESIFALLTWFLSVHLRL